jgi:tetratricopeptide (TPR) repeat protein
MRAARVRAIELARQVPLSIATARALGRYARQLAIIEADYPAAVETAREVLVFADESGDERLAVESLNTIGMARVHSGDPGGIEELEDAVRRAESAAVVSERGTALNNLGNCLWRLGRLDEGSARLSEAVALATRYGITSGIAWQLGEEVYDRDYHGDLDGVLAAAARFLESDGAESYQLRPVLATRAHVFLARDQVADAVSDAEGAIAGLRESAPDAQISGPILLVASRCFRAAGRREESEELLAEALSTAPNELGWDMPLYLVELGRRDEYLALTDGHPGHRWQEAGRAAASGELLRASEIYGEMGARFPEAWAALLAAEAGDTSRLDAALAYFEEQRATPYAQRCRALMQASA